VIATIAIDALARQAIWETAQHVGYLIENETPFGFDGPSPEAEAEQRALTVSDTIMMVVRAMGPLPPPWWQAGKKAST
jgi:hypothetical protein